MVTERQEEKPTRKKENKERQRRRDQSLGDFRSRMVVPEKVITWAKKNDRVLRWINDEKARISYAQANDWDFVQFKGGSVGEIEQPGDLGDCYSMIVGRDKSGQDIRAYLMCKRKDWHEADQTEKQKEVDKIDESINAGTAHKQQTENMYAKEIKYEPTGKRLRS